MKIAQISSGNGEILSENRGAIESVIYTLSKQLSKDNEVTIFDRGEKSLFIEGITIVGIPLPSLYLPVVGGNVNFTINEILFAQKLRKAISKRDFNLIHAHHTFTGWASSKIAEKKKIPLIFTCHAYIRGIHSIIWRKVLLKSTKVVAVSNFVKTQISKFIPEDKITVIYNGIDVKTYRPGIKCEGLREKYKLREKVVLFVGGIMPYKGLEYLVKAAELVVHRFNTKDVSFVIVGDPNWTPKYSKQIKNLVQEKSLKDYFLFTGRVPLQEKLEFYSICDVFVLPSLYEGFPMVLQEAMACGKPVIGSTAGGIPEIIKHGENGFLFKVGDYKVLAEKILILLNDERMSKEMGKKGRRIAVQNFSYERMANEYIKVYKEVLGVMN